VRTHRAVLTGPLIAVIMLVAAIAATGAAGVTFRDPDHVAAQYVLEVGAGIAALIGLDTLLRAGWRGRGRPDRARVLAVWRTRWTRPRLVAVGVSVFAFYASYLAYRNLKGTLPLLRPGVLFDDQLRSADRWLAGGHDPATLLHDLLGTGIAAQVFSTAYVAFIVFLPLSLAVSLVFAEGIDDGLFLTAALSINWGLGIASYFLLPSLGPIYSVPSLFAALPHTEAAHLQQMLMDQRHGFLADPGTGTPQAIAAFASLHIAMSATAAVAAHLLGAGPRLKQALWAWLAITWLGTVYLGWHFVVDDVAGLAMAAIALALARALTGVDLSARRALRAAARTPAVVTVPGTARRPTAGVAAAPDR
jgi:hypothetical protein